MNTAGHTAADSEEASLKLENERLRKRIEQLESELSASKDDQSPLRRVMGEKTEDSLREIPNHMLDEGDRLTRAVSYAIAESLRTASDTILTFADTLRSRTESHPRSSGAEGKRSRTTADDLLASAASALHESLDTPRRVVERVYGSYHSNEGAK